MSYERRTKRSVLSLCGLLPLELGVWHCTECDVRHRPCADRLGLDGSGVTLAMQQAIVRVASVESHRGAAELLRIVAGVAVSPKRVERVVRRVGARIAADERTVVAEPAADAEPADLAVIELDGTGVGMRAEALEGVAGKGEDGQARTREAKLAVVHSETDGQRDAISYNAAIESAAQSAAGEAPFCERVLREAVRSGYFQARRGVALGDGAPWIWNLYEHWIPHATQVLDKFHVLEKIHAVCVDSDLDADAAARAFARMKAWLDDSRLDAVQRTLAELGGAEVVRYIDSNRSRMDYRRYRKEGLPCSTARVESACKNVVGARMKRGGMRWSLAGANAMLALLSCTKSGRLDDYFQRLRQSTREEIGRYVKVDRFAVAGMQGLG